MKDPTLYILMRSDLQSMSPGRKMAQASHATNAFIFENPKAIGLREWQKQTKQGFGTAIVLAVNSQEMFNLITHVKNTDGSVANSVIDPEYGIRISNEIFRLIDDRNINKTIVNEDDSVTIFREEYTCAYAFGSKEILSPILKDLPLHP